MDTEESEVVSCRTATKSKERAHRRRRLQMVHGKVFTCSVRRAQLYLRAACKLSKTYAIGYQKNVVQWKVSDQLQLTSSSIFASAISCSLPLPLAIFCASEI